MIAAYKIPIIMMIIILFGGPMQHQQIIVMIYPTVLRSGWGNRIRAESFYDD